MKGRYIVLILALTLSGCRARSVPRSEVQSHVDTVGVMMGEQALIEETNQRIQVEWWGDAADLPRLLGGTDTTLRTTSSGRGGVVWQVQEQKRIGRRDEQALSARREQNHSRVEARPSSCPRRWWRIGMVIAILTLIGWVGLNFRKNNLIQL